MRQPGEPAREPPWYSNEPTPPSAHRQRSLDGSGRSVDAGGWYNAPRNHEASPPELNPNWIHIPDETMRELRAKASDERRYLNVVQGLPNTAQLTGHPIHQIDGKWYVEVKPQGGGWMSPDEARKLLGIQELLEVGSFKYDAAADRIGIWDGEQWLQVPESCLR